jgi:hypothetical protein
LKIGTTVIDWLIENKILIEFIANKNKINIPMITFYKQLDLEISRIIIYKIKNNAQ